MSYMAWCTFTINSALIVVNWFLKMFRLFSFRQIKHFEAHVYYGAISWIFVFEICFVETMLQSIRLMFHCLQLSCSTSFTHKLLNVYIFIIYLRDFPLATQMNKKAILQESVQLLGGEHRRIVDTAHISS